MPETDVKNPLFAGFLQFDVRSGDTVSNLSSVQKGLSEIAASGAGISPGIIVLPELWATGFAYDKLPELAKETPDILKILQNLAAKYGIIIAGSLPEHSNNSYYNTLFITASNGIIGTYRKQQLFSPMQEDSFFAPGTAPLPVQTDLAHIGALVCYDLRFPELMRHQANLGADIAVVSAQWPAARIGHWRILLQARAIENQMFVIAANRCGTTGDNSFGGHSMIIGPDGTILLEAGGDRECKGTILDPVLISSARSLFRSLL